MTEQVQGCGVLGCKEPSIGFTELYRLSKWTHGLPIAICVIHNKALG